MRLSLHFAPLLALVWFAQPALSNRFSCFTASHLPLIKTSAPIAVATPGILPNTKEDLQLQNIQSGQIQSAFSSSIADVTEQALLTSVTERDWLVGSRWLTAWGVLLAGGALAWGGSSYVRQQRWQRLEFLRQAVKEFEQDVEIRTALKILDFEEYRDYCMPGDAKHESVSFRVDEDLLCNALASHDKRARQKQRLDYSKDRGALDLELLRQYQIETTLRDWFNKMLNGLEHFGYLLESGLFTEEELRPWMSYWIKLIAEPAYRRPGASKFYNALYSYIHHSGFFGVQKLFERFGYRILPSPYTDFDLIKVARAAPGYSTQTALTLAKAAYLAYQDKQFVAEIVGRWGGAIGDRNPNQMLRNDFRYFNNKGRDTQAYMLRTEQFMVLAFRGSQEPQDWLTNLTTQLRNFTLQKDGVATLSSYQGRVHTGFFLGWAIIEQSVLAQIARWQKDFASKGKRLPPLYITGHSLGGALATIAAAALVESNIEVAGVYTFGQPRVGDRTFVSQLNSRLNGKIFRFVNNNDLVPHVPPPFSVWNPTHFYGHVGKATYFDGKGILTLSANYKLTRRLTDIMSGLAKGAVGSGFNYITDHRMEYYISHLEGALKEETENKISRMLDVG
ncbi:MAG: lipase family protein [Phormidesmis sp.]